MTEPPVEQDVTPAYPLVGRFLTLDDVAVELATSRAQVYALVRADDLHAIKIGGRGQWRVERVELERYLSRTYAETRRWVRDHPFAEDAPIAADEL